MLFNPRTNLCGRIFPGCGRDRVAVSVMEDSHGYRYAFYRTKDGTIRSGPALADPDVSASIHWWIEQQHASPGLAEQLDRWLAEVRLGL